MLQSLSLEVWKNTSQKSLNKPQHDPPKSEKNLAKDKNWFDHILHQILFTVITTMECVTLTAPSNEVQIVSVN